ncbi:uncharacterized protein BCR38DRAFT_347250 [Pseudomassariella vexata]|uniref:Uncharacterized protein n=1 Tax=Pseudomassariella vexata TaxID=1141098 RepID=A0A1Y2DQW7_9PEZI|nr:uncharacterized protein BCR38DRAFT_347250 [Pseudomassariella vexata]ORY61660.1 hypothetical protein BCR38DRAFT_347250 [Pseudomassariella vexata]
MLDQYSWPESTRKRARDDEEVVTGFTEHRNKRLHSLPVRTSPPHGHKRWSHPPSFTPHVPATITPADSDSEEQWHSQARQGSQMEDTDMMAVEEPKQFAQYLAPGSLQPDPLGPSITARMPTPIHCSFAEQVRSKNHIMNTGFSQPHPFPHAADPSVPRSVDSGAAWSMVQNRRLPSPISESGGEETPASPSMVLDSCSMAQLSLQRPQLPHHPHSMNPMAALHPNLEVIQQEDSGMMDMDCSRCEEAGSPSSAPATPSPRGKYGHSRSKHTLNSWTLQPGMKKSFSIGYRADCEKCRLKIPGHFNHIIVS